MNAVLLPILAFAAARPAPLPAAAPAGPPLAFARTADARRFETVPPHGGWVLDSSGAARAGLVLRFVRARREGPAVAEKQLPGTFSDFRGRDPLQWRSAEATWARVRFEDVWPGIDVVWYDPGGGGLEFDLVVRGEARRRRVELEFPGAEHVELVGPTLVVTSPAGRLRVGAPRAWLEGRAGARPVALRYELASRGRVAIRLPRRGRGETLRVDPLLEVSSYLGGSAGDEAFRIARDAAGDVFLSGSTASPDFPATLPALGGGGQDLYVAKLDASGTALLWSVRVGGSGWEDSGRLALGPGGEPYLIGRTTSLDYPVVDAAQPGFAGVVDACVTRIAADGRALLYSTYLGSSGDELPVSIAVDAAGRAFVVGYTRGADFPVVNAIQPSLRGFEDLFVTRLSTSGRAFEASTYYGGRGVEQGIGIALDAASGDVVLSGVTNSDDFPVVQPWQPQRGGLDDAFLMRLDASLGQVRWATYFGGSDQEQANFAGDGLDAHPAAGICFGGSTQSTDLPLARPTQPVNAGNVDMFVACFDDAGQTLGFATYLGGSFSETMGDVEFDEDGVLAVVGATDSLDFPLVDAFQPVKGGGNASADAVLARLDILGARILDASYHGGSELEYGVGLAASRDAVWMCGLTNSLDLPRVSALQPTFGGPPMDGWFARVGGYGGCVSPPAEPVVGVTAVRGPRPEDVTLAWTPLAGADGYAVWRTLVAEEIPNAREPGSPPTTVPVAACRPTATTTCTDAGAVLDPAPLLFYQVRGRCGSLEGV